MGRAALLLPWLLVACVEEPGYEGRLCGANDPCPGELFCVFGRCSSTPGGNSEDDAGRAPLDAGVLIDAGTKTPDASERDGADAEAAVDGGPADSGTPDAAPGPVLALASTNKHALALRSNGTVVGWGWNEGAQIAGPPYDLRTTPTSIPIEGVDRIAAGGRMSLARTRDGRVWSWGDNTFGQLGRGVFGPPASAMPAPVVGPAGAGVMDRVVQIAAGHDFALVLRDDGLVWSFGRNTYGQLGMGTMNDSPVPVQVDIAYVVAIAAGAFHGVALLDDGTVWSWGYNEYGQLGDDVLPEPSPWPVPAVAPVGDGLLEGVLAISAGWGHTMAVDDFGDLYVWGWNAYGQLGDDKPGDRPWPDLVLDVDHNGWLENVVAIDAGYAFSMALLADGRLVSWGFNGFGQLGHGNLEDAWWPGVVETSPGVPFRPAQLEGGGDHALARTLDGVVWSWGRGDHGEMANGATTHRDRPAPIPGL